MLLSGTCVARPPPPAAPVFFFFCLPSCDPRTARVGGITARSLNEERKSASENGQWLKWGCSSGEKNRDTRCPLMLMFWHLVLEKCFPLTSQTVSSFLTGSLTHSLSQSLTRWLSSHLTLGTVTLAGQ